MFEIFRLLKLEYKEYIILIKSGSFYCGFDEDAIVLNKIFNYKVNQLKKNLKVGFPVSLIEKNTNILKRQKINYIVVEDEKIVKREKFKFNNYSKYIENVFDIVSMNARINYIYESLKSMSDKKSIKDKLNRIEEIIHE